MIQIVYYTLMFVLCFACPARVGAQEAPATDATWLLTLETIKAGSSQLMAQNNRLIADYNRLVQDIDRLNASIEEQSRKNAALADFLKTRHGRTDQQVRARELEGQINGKRDELKRRQRAPKPESELDRLRKELKVEKANEAKLEADLLRRQAPP